MRSQTKKIGLSVVAVICSLALSACLSSMQGSRKGAGSGLSVDVTVDGIEPGDEKLEGIKYEMICNMDSSKPMFKVVGSAKPANQIEFRDDQIKLGDKCAIEVTATQKKHELGDFEWLAVKNKQRIEGLFYSSNIGTVEGRKEGAITHRYLELSLFKTYRIRYADEFTARVAIKFSLEDAGALPEKDIIASLECDKKTFATSEYKKVDPKEASLLEFAFKVSASLAKNKSCSKVVVALNNQPFYSAELKDVSFTEPKKGDVIPTSDKPAFGPFVATVTQEVIGVASCASRTGEGVCTDVKMPQGGAIWFAIVSAKNNTTGQMISDKIIVGHQFGFANDSSPTLSVDQINSEAHASSGRFNFYKESAKVKVLGLPFNPSDLQTAISGDAVANVPAFFQNVDFSIVQINEVHVHGVRTVSETFMNTLAAPARWFAKIIATNGALQNEFIVGGGAKYFASSVKLAQNAFFTEAAYKQNSAPNDNGYRTYALKTSRTKAANCELTLNYLTHTFGFKSTSQVTASDAAIDQCEITDVPSINQYTGAGWRLFPRFYLWSWHAFTF